MTHQNYRSYDMVLSEIKESLADYQRRDALKVATERFRKGKEEGLARLRDREQYLRKTRAVKEQVVDSLDQYVTQLSKAVKDYGGQFFLARSGAEAAAYVRDLALSRNVRLVVKSKSLTSEEIFLNEELERHGIEAVETDLGERIVQLAKEKPSHFVAPAVHKDRVQIADLFSRHLGFRIPSEIPEITKAVRAELRGKFLDAGIGITGANAVTADSGTLVIVTNEGNARLVSSLPPIHVAIVGIEKIVPTIEDALTLVDVLPRSANGQDITTYVSFIRGKSRTYQPIGFKNQDEFHLVMVDNGRRQAVEDRLLRETMYCIRCSACMNVCPTYKIVGGHVFGHVYPGPIGIPWTYVTHGLEAAAPITPLCISCGLCGETCPQGIDIPLIISLVKQKKNQKQGQVKIDRFLGNYENLVSMAASLAPLSNWLLKSGTFRYLLEKLVEIDRRRRFPMFSRKKFIDWFSSHNSEGHHRVVYFVDVYANFNDPELGKDVVKVLERNDCQVLIPPQKSSGMPLVMYGDLEGARRIAEYNIRSLIPFVRDGCEVVASEPTAAYCLHDVYPRLLPGDDAQLVAAHSHELFGYLSSLSEKGLFIPPVQKFGGQKVTYHTPCHTKSLYHLRPVPEILRLIGLQVFETEHGCCGMAGTFGFKKGAEGYDLSLEIGKPLFEQFQASAPDFACTESSVCRMHIEQATGYKVLHPATLLRRAYELA